MIVSSLCAIVITVWFVNSHRIVFWTSLSVKGSTFAVASSISRIPVRFNSALAKQNNWFWPVDRLSPLLSRLWSSWPSRLLTNLSNWTCLSAVQIDSSVAFSLGSRLVLIDPVRILRGPKYDGFSKTFHQFETISHLPFSVFSENCN